MSNFPKRYQDDFEKYFIEKEDIEKAALHCEIEKPVFQSDVADREELTRHERIQQFDKKKDVQMTIDIVKSVVTGNSAKWSG